MAEPNVRGAPAIAMRGKNMYPGGNSAGGGRPPEAAGMFPVNTVSTTPKMAELNLGGAIERKLRGSFAPKSPTATAKAPIK